ncbi:MAG: low molecular weight phosphotyrosine protein phosphatase [Leptospiraceae bacterium]|nr:low molecular weight phosphotyrosine protein phosphatase [Leptospiraceae bacterium]MCB1316457.1 low molecular weight phosphotyrosine protein phosphatase [Leptospiraceae bacterium]
MSSRNNTIGVLFVCLGNICRSPAAEGTFRHLVSAAGLEKYFHIDSCGTSAYHIGEPANANSRRVAKKRGFDLHSRARQFHRADFQKFDYILAMDRSNYADLMRLAESGPDKERVHMYRKFDPEVHTEDSVPDPYYGGPEGFEEVQDIVLRTGENFLTYLRENHNLK